MKDLSEKSPDDLYNAKFRNLDLSDNQLAEKEFERCTFTKCNFKGTRFKKCVFLDCRFIECDLSLVDLGYSRFAEVQFEGSKLLGVNWTKGGWSSVISQAPICFSRCNVNDSSFFGLRMNETEMSLCQARDTDFRDADFSRSNFAGTDFRNSLFGNTDLTYVNFEGAVDYHIDVRMNKIEGAMFCRLEATSLLAGLGIKFTD